MIMTLEPMSTGKEKPKIVIEARIPLERKDQITKVVFNDGALAALKLTTERYMQHGFNDLLVFMASPGQDGSTRIIDQVAVIENNVPNTEYRGDLGVEVDNLRQRDPNLKTMLPIGIGSVVGYLDSVRAAINLGYKFYASCGDKLYENGQIPDKSDAGYWTVWGQDGEDIAEIESVVETTSN